MSPNAITLAGPLLAIIPAYFAYAQSYLFAGIALAAASLVDALDGAVARARDRVTRFGGYLDSVLDRASDAIVLVGIGLGRMDEVVWLVLGLGLIGQYLTSYARARAYQDAAPPVETWQQWFERPERILFLVLALLAQGIVDRVRPETEVLVWMLLIYAAATLGTAAVRVWRVRDVLSENQK